MSPTRTVLPCIALLLGCALVSCTKEQTTTEPVPPVTPPDPPSAGAPTIKSIGPLAGGYNTVVTIAGTNFSAEASEDSVWFNGKLATVIVAKTDTLRVAVPLGAGTGPILVSVKGRTDSFSTFRYEQSWIVTTVAGGGARGFVEGPATGATLVYPHAITIDQHDNIYFSENASRVGKITPAGHFTPYAGRESRGFKDTVASHARFNAPDGLAVDAAGNVYVADRDNSRIRRISPNGEVSTFAGGPVYGYTDGAGQSAQFWSPLSAAADRQGNIYVADQSNHRLRKITPGGVVSTLAGSGTWGFQDGPAGTAQFRDMLGIAVDSEGNVYVADDASDRIRKVSPGGEVITFAGSGINGMRNGPAGQAQFSHPTGVAVDSKGNVYVADNSNQLIRKITPTGEVSTLAGKTETKGYVDGPAATALFYYPNSVAVDSKGNVYVTETGNHRIRKISFE